MSAAQPDRDWLLYLEELAAHPAADPAAVARRLEIEAAIARALASIAPSAAPQPAATDSPAYLSPSAFALRLGVDRKTIDRQLEAMTEGTHYLRVGRRIVINVENATAFLAGRSAAAANDDLLAAFDAKARRPRSA